MVFWSLLRVLHGRGLRRIGLCYSDADAIAQRAGANCGFSEVPFDVQCMKATDHKPHPSDGSLRWANGRAHIKPIDGYQWSPIEGNQNTGVGLMSTILLSCDALIFEVRSQFINSHYLNNL